MAIIGFPYNSQNRDRAIKAEVYRRLLSKYFTTGVFPNPSTQCQVVAGGAMNVTIKKGSANINGLYVELEEDVTVELNAPDTLDRYDRIVLRNDDNKSVRATKVIVIKGIPSEEPTPPELTRNDTVYDICLANVLVSQMDSKVENHNIEDTRLNKELCGIVSATIESIDATTFYNQIQADLQSFKENEQADFQEWFDTIKGILGTDEAGKLLQMVQANTSRIVTNENDIEELTQSIDNVGSKLNSEISRATQKESELSSRMDTFTKLEEGSTTGDAELIDGRVGADDKVYENIGGAIRSQVSQLSNDIINQYQNILDNNNLAPDILFDNLTESWGENNTWYYNWTDQYTYNVIKSKEVLYKGFPTLSVQLSNAIGETIVINHRINLEDYIDKEVYAELAMYVEGESIPEMAQLGIGRTTLNFRELKSGWNSVKGTIIVPRNETIKQIRLVVGGNCHVYFSPVLITYNYIPNKYTRLTIEETVQEIKKAIKEGTDWKREIEYAMPKNNKNEITVDISVPYNYCDDIPLYLYLETLFNEQVSITNGIGGMNQIVQDASIGGFWTQNINGTPKGKKVEIATNKKVLFIGDSYTAAGVYPKHVYDKITALGKTLTLIGTQGESPYKHEGHSGWRNYTYAYCAKGSDDVLELGDTLNPFWNPTTEEFDFSYYIQNNSLSTPDIVFINLGTNDFTQTVERTDAETLNAMNAIVNSIKSYDSNIKIIHWCPALTPIGIKGFANHWDGIIKYTNLLVKNFTDLCPVRYAVSPTEDGQFETKVINGHEYRVLKDWNHPSDIGYEHIANMICGYITN